MIKIKDIYAGKPDAKDEIENEGFDQFLSSYIEPINFNVNALLNDSFCFISGYKGTGKTALLYYLDFIAKERDPQTCSSFVFFKGDFADMHRQDMVLTSKRMFSSISIGNDVIKDGNDFEYIWRWLFYQRIWEDNKDFNLGLFNDDENWQKFDKILSKISNFSIKRKLSIPPKMKFGIPIVAGSVKVDPEVEIDFTKPKVTETQQYRQLVEFIDQLDIIFPKLNKSDIPYYIFVDELEAYCGEEDIFKRDLRIIRDLIFSVKKLNSIMPKNNTTHVKIICSVRKEILNSINRFIVTKELNKVISGFDIPLVWNYTNTNSFGHPIIKILTKRISLSYKLANLEITEREIIQNWFPERIENSEPTNYILNISWNKPRDIVRLIICAKSCLCSENSSFNQSTMDMLKKEYSRESLIEIKEEMRALYTEEEIDSILLCLRGYRVSFTAQELYERVNTHFKDSVLSTDFNKVLDDLYRLGVIGNYSKSSGYYRWQHKGDECLILSDDWKIIIHKGLQTALSLSNKHDNGITYRKGVPQPGDKVIATIMQKKSNVYLVTFDKDGRTYDGYFSLKFSSSNLQNKNIGTQINAKILSYNSKFKNYSLIEDR